MIKRDKKNTKTAESGSRKSTPKKTSKTPRNEEAARRKRWVFGLLLLITGVYLLCAIGSFFMTWKFDQAFAEWGNVNPSSDVKNLCGPLGAKIANTLVSRWFGVFAVLLPLLLSFISVKILRKSYNGIFKILIGGVLAVVIGSVAISYFTNNVLWHSTIFGYGPGGMIGVEVSTWLRGIFGEVGTGLIISLFIMMLALYLNAERTIEVLGSIGRGVSKSSKNAVTIATKTVGEIGHKNLDGQSEVKSDDELISETDDSDTFIEDKGVELTVEQTADLDTDEMLSEDMQVVQGVEDEEAFEVIKLPDSDNESNVTESEHSAPMIVDRDSNEEQLDVQSIDTSYDHTLDLSHYRKPSIELLEDHHTDVEVSDEELRENTKKIIDTLENFGIKIDIKKATIGPTVTLYEIIPSAGNRISKIKNLENDIALSLAALGIRIIAPMPGRGTIGIEVPNKNPKIVSMYSVVKTVKFQESNYELPIVLGKTIQNETYVVDLAKMPHLLVAGATGQGKSVGLNVLLTSLLYKKHPSELKFVLVDPKKVELSIYSKLEKHFLAKMPSEDDAIITDTQKVIYTLNSLCIEMESRYTLLQKATVKSIKEYNDKFTNRKLNPNHGHKYLPYIVVVVDEFADMIMTAGKEVERPIALLAQKSRAVGIHLVIATQRPTTNIITGVIKANFPTRIGFRVISMIDSRTILDQPGANQLIGRGDMLISTAGGEMTRVQCAFIDTPEIERIVDFIAEQQSYTSAYELPEYDGDSGDSMGGATIDLSRRDAMFEQVAYMVVSEQQGSTSAIQRKFEIGYNRAGRIMDQLQAAGIVGKANGSKPREVLITDLDSLKQILNRIDYH